MPSNDELVKAGLAEREAERRLPEVYEGRAKNEAADAIRCLDKAKALRADGSQSGAELAEHYERAAIVCAQLSAAAATLAHMAETRLARKHAEEQAQSIMRSLGR